MGPALTTTEVTGGLPPRRTGRRRPPRSAARPAAGPALARPRPAPGPHAGAWLRLLTALVVIGLCAAGGWVRQRHGAAEAQLKAAASQQAGGRYSAASATLVRAQALWPWLPIASQQAELQTLAASDQTYRRGLAAMAAGSYVAAAADLARVVPADIAYADAQTRLKVLRTGLADAALAQAVGAASSDLDADLASFWAWYHTAMDDLVPAWEQYGFGNPTPYEAAASAPVNALTSVSARLAHDGTTLSRLLACRAGTSGIDSADLGAAVRSTADAAKTAGEITRLGAAGLHALTHDSALEVSQQVPEDISAINADASTLQADRGSAAAAAVRWQSAAVRAVDRMLGKQTPTAALVPAGSAPLTALLKACGVSAG